MFALTKVLSIMVINKIEIHLKLQTHIPLDKNFVENIKMYHIIISIQIHINWTIHSLYTYLFKIKIEII